MKRRILLTFTLLTTLCCYSQDYKIEKIKQLTKEKFKITRLLIATESVNNEKINTFISDFTVELNGYSGDTDHTFR